MVSSRELLTPLLIFCLISFITGSIVRRSADETSSVCEPDLCPENSTCTPIGTDDQYQCECKDGYNRIGGGDTDPICEDICALCPTNSNCKGGSEPICECPKNRRLQQKENGSLECVHICETDQSICHEHSRCVVKEDDSYKCECNKGFTQRGDSDCVLIVCDPGYKLVGLACVPKTCDEMHCDPHGKCNPGKDESSPPTCECEQNFVVDGEGCSHICSTNQHGCENNSECLRESIHSSRWSCECEDGFTKNREGTCVEMGCLFGRKKVDGKCVPKTCEEMKLNCPENQQCMEADRYRQVATCECMKGFHAGKSAGDFKVCVIDTCDETKCGPNQECKQDDPNSPATCECVKGFKPEFNRGTKVCVPDPDAILSCEDIKCKMAHQECKQDDPKVSATCQCKTGFKEQLLRGVMECVQIEPISIKKCGDIECLNPNQECVQPNPEVSATCKCKSGFTTVTVKGVTVCTRHNCSVADLNCGENGSKQPIFDDDGTEFGCECQCHKGWKGDKCDEKKVEPILGICDQVASCPSSDPPGDRVLNRACQGYIEPTESNPCPNCADGFELKEGKCVPTNPCDGVDDSIICKKLDERIPGNYTFCPRGFENKDGTCVKTIQTCSPIIASEAGCEQDCTVELDTKSSRGYKVTCECFNGYTLLSDGKKCERNPNGCDDTVCKGKDQNSLCVTDSNNSSISTCECKRGFVLGPDGKCVDYCQPDQLEDDDLKGRIKKEIRSICGATIVNCTSLTPESQICPDCPPDHERNIITGFCDMIDPCNPGGIGVKSCQVKGNKVCRREIASIVAPLRSAFRCSCDGGFYMDTSIENNPCIDQEKVEKFVKKCSNEGKVPKKRLTTDEPDCMCANPTHVNIRNADGHYKCEQPEYSIMIHNLTFSLKIDDYTTLVKKGKPFTVYGDLKLNCDESPDPEGCSRYQALMQAEQEQKYHFYNDPQREEIKTHAVSVALEQSLNLALEGLTVTEFLLQETKETKNNSFKSKLLVVTKELKFGTQLMRKLQEDCVRTGLNGGDSCVLNEIIIYNLNSTIIRRFDECADDASAHRRCENVWNEYECKCDSGFKPSDTGVKDRNLNCIDIDECETGTHQCPSDSQCVNTVGSYQCKCNDGMKQTSSLPPDGIGKCVKDYCFGKGCNNRGKPEITMDENGEGNGCICKCEKGWKGLDCRDVALEPWVELDGWSEVTLARNPPIGVDEQYFYVDEKTSRLNIKPSFTEAIVKDVQKMTVTFDYWIDSDSMYPRDEQPFELRFEQCFHLRTFLPNKWMIYGEWHEYNSDTENPTHPIHHDVLDCLNNASLVIQLKQDFSSFVAIKNFKISYAFKELKTGQERTTDFKCTTPENCKTSFINNEEPVKWSTLGQRPNRTNFLTPAKSGDKLTVRFRNMNWDSFYDARINFQYWINSPSGIVSLKHKDSTLLRLFRSRLFISDSRRITWFEGTVRFSDLAPDYQKEPINDVIDIDFVADIVGDYHATLIAMKIDVEQVSESIFTYNWNGRRAMITNITETNQETDVDFLDPVVGISRVMPQLIPHNTVQVVPDNDLTNTSYTLFSSWIKASQNPLDFTAFVTHETFSDGEYETHVTLNMLELNSGGRGNWVEKKLKSIKFSGTKRDYRVQGLLANVGGGGSGTLRKFTIVVTTKKTTERFSTVTIGEIGFGDACMFDPCNEEREGNTCKRVSPGVSKCECDIQNIGDFCEFENFCHTNGGNEYCKNQRKGNGKKPNYCRSLNVPPTTSREKTFECICDNNKEYWDTSNRKCTVFSECLRLISCPEPGTKCNDTDWDPKDPCPDCAEGFEKSGDGKCQEIDVCEQECGSNVPCFKLRRTPHSRPEAICYCPNGFDMVDDGGEKSCQSRLEEKGCPEIFRVSAGCQHGCETNVTNGGIRVNCTCRPGYKLNGDGKTCAVDGISIENCCTTDQGYKNHICVLGLGHTIANVLLVSPKIRITIKLAKPSILVRTKMTSFLSVEKMSKNVFLHPQIISSTVHVHLNNMKLLKSRLDLMVLSVVLFLIHVRKIVMCTRYWDKSLRNCALNIIEKVPFTQAHYTCPPGKNYDSETNRCVDQCEIRENIVECVRQNKVCQTNPLSANPKCVCQPGFLEVPNLGTSQTRCELSEKSVYTTRIEVIIPQVIKYNHIEPEKQNFKCSDYPDPGGCLRRIQQHYDYFYRDRDVINEEKMLFLEQQLKQGFSIIYSGTSPGYHEISLLNRSYSLIDENRNRRYKDVQLVVEYDRKVEATDPKDVIELMSKKCYEKKSIGNQTYCVIPGGLHFTMTDMLELPKNSNFLSPCSEDDDIKKVHYCSEGSKCDPILLSGMNDTFPFTCSCPRHGLKINNILEMNHTLTSLAAGNRQMEPRIIRKESCEDIDECFLSIDDCPSNSTCVNTFGSFNCNCGWGSILTGGTGNELKLCKHVCDGNECKNGHCHVDENNPQNFICRCHEGYRGRFCEIEDHKLYLLRSWVIFVWVLLGVALIIAILFACHYKNKKSSEDKGRMIFTSSEGTPLTSSPSINNIEPPEDRLRRETPV